MYYVKATGWVILGLGIWISSYFVAVILTLAGCIYALKVAIKMENEDDQ